VDKGGKRFKPRREIQKECLFAEWRAEVNSTVRGHP